MKESDVIQELNTMRGDDPKIDHCRADDLLCEFLRAKGFGDVAEAYERAANRVGFWYA